MGQLDPPVVHVLKQGQGLLEFKECWGLFGGLLHLVISILTPKVKHFP